MHTATADYRSDIDGLRAVAVLAVVLYHAGIPGITGGFVGVDVFFVISGYLITSIIVSKADRGTFSIVEFWERRVRRILPPLFAMMLFTLVCSYFLLFPNDFRDFGESLVAITVFSSNFLFWTESGYFAEPAELKPLLHTWSLSIEEQFYLFFPMLMVMLSGKAKAIRLPVVIAIIAVSFAISMVWLETSKSSAFYLLPSRAWELAIGSLLVFMRMPTCPAPLLNAVAAAGLAMIAYACFFYDHSTPFPGSGAILPCVGTALIIFAHSNGQKSVVHQFLSLRPMVFIGLLSYSLYLWHWPLLVFPKYHSEGPLSIPLALSLMVLAGVLAWLSLKYIEGPFRTGQILKSRKSAFLGAFVGAAFFASVGLYAHLDKGMPSRLDDQVLKLYQGHEYINPRRKECMSFEKQNFSKERICAMGPESDKTEFLMLGDSHADALMPVIDKLASDTATSGIFMGYNGCPPLSKVYRVDTSNQHNCAAFNDYAIQQLQERQIDKVLLVGRWSFYPQDRMILATDENGQRPDNWLAKGKGSAEEAKQAFEDGISTMLAAIPETTSIYLFRQVPLQQADVSPRYVSSQLWQGNDVESLGVSRKEHDERQRYANDYLDALAAKMGSRVKLIDPTPLLCQDSSNDGAYCPVVVDGGSVYRDDDHISRYGALRLEPLFTEFFAK